MPGSVRRQRGKGAGAEPEKSKRRYGPQGSGDRAIWR